MRKSFCYLIPLTLMLMAILSLGIEKVAQNELLAQDQVECTVIVQPGESIQQAIDAAEKGAVICLAEGTWEENVKIGNSLSLRGMDAERTVIDGVKEEYPVVWIATPGAAAQMIPVKLERLRITGAEGRGCSNQAEGVCTAGVLVQGRARVEITEATISYNGVDPFGYGLLVTGPARVTIFQSTIVGNPTILELRDTAQLELQDSVVRGGRFGIELRDASEATVGNATISGVYWSAVRANDRAGVRITHSTVARNGGGIEVAGSARAEVDENVIERNSGCGITVHGSGEVKGRGNRMSGNGADLCGNLSGELRLPLAEPTEEEIVYPNERYGSLQEAVDALRPGGRLVMQAGEYTPGVTIAKTLTLEAAPGAHVVLMGDTNTWRSTPPVLSLIAGARLRLRGVEIIGGNPGLLLAADAQAVIEECTITGNWWTGIEARDTASLEVIASTISDNGDGRGVLLAGSAWARIVHSAISENGLDGLMIRDAAGAELLGNRITANSVYGVVLYESCVSEGDEGETPGLVQVSGCGNLIPSPGELEGNQAGDVCPASLRFLEEPCAGSD